MACGCLTKCDCRLLGDLGITIMGSGESGDPYVITPPPETVFGAGPIDDSIDIIPGGAYGHAPLIGVRIDTAGSATPTLSAAGLRFDCCGGGAVNYTSAMVNADYTVDVSTDYAIFVDSSGGQVNISLPLVFANGDTVQISDLDGTANTHIVTIGPATINGLVDYIMSIPYESVTLMAFGGDWLIV